MFHSVLNTPLRKSRDEDPSNAKQHELVEESKSQLKQCSSKYCGVEI